MSAFDADSPSVMPPSPGGGKSSGLYVAAGILFVLLLWQGLSLLAGDLAIAPPAAAFKALFRMMGTPVFQRHFLTSVWRILLAIFLGGLAGFSLGIIAGLNRRLYLFLEPLRWTLMSVPPVTILVLAMLWLGLGGRMVVTFASLLLSPVIYVNTVKGMRLVEKSLVEMSAFYRFSLTMRLRHVYIPALTAPLLAGMAQVVCGGVRVIVLAEVLGAGLGMGAAIADASSGLDTPVLFAWIFVSVCFVAVIEYLILRPLQARMLRWNQP